METDYLTQTILFIIFNLFLLGMCARIFSSVCVHSAHLSVGLLSYLQPVPRSHAPSTVQLSVHPFS